MRTALRARRLGSRAGASGTLLPGGCTRQGAHPHSGLSRSNPDQSPGPLTRQDGSRARRQCQRRPVAGTFLEESHDHKEGLSPRHRRTSHCPRCFCGSWSQQEATCHVPVSPVQECWKHVVYTTVGPIMCPRTLRSWPLSRSWDLSPGPTGLTRQGRGGARQGHMRRSLNHSRRRHTGERPRCEDGCALVSLGAVTSWESLAR